jgi:protein O-GlcNAc transferase
VVQCEVEFVELYEGQPLMADVDTFLRNAGFSFLKFSSLQGRPFKPLRLEQQPLSPISQILWADAVYVRDFRDLSRWSNRQLKAASFLLHELYNASDLVSLLLGEIDLREGTDVQSLYLASMLMSNPSLVIG